MPRDLKEQIEKLEEIFVVPTQKLKEITDHFVKELEKGLTTEGGSIVSSPGKCMWGNSTDQHSP